MGDVVRQKSRYFQICICTEVQHGEVLRQSLDCNYTRAPVGVIKSGPVQPELSSGLAKEGCHLLVDWWNYSPRRKNRWDREKEIWRSKGIEVLF